MYKRVKWHITVVLMLLPILIFSQDGRSRYRRSIPVFDMKFGARASFGRSWHEGDDFIVRSGLDGHDYEQFTKFKGLNGYALNVYSDIKFTDRNYLLVEISMVNKGWKQEGSFGFSPFVPVISNAMPHNKVEVKYQIWYLELPIQYRYKIANRFFGMIGPYFALKMKEKYEISNDYGMSFPDTLRNQQYYLDNNFGLTMGLTYQIKTGLNFNIEYQHGLSDIAEYYDVINVPVPRYHQISTRFSVGYTINYFNRFTNYKRRRKGKL